MEAPIYPELDQPKPRAVRRRWHTFDGEFDPNFDPWRGWDYSWKMLASGILLMLTSWIWYQFSFSAIVFFLASAGLMLTVVGVLFCASGLLTAHNEINGQRFLVSRGDVAVATVTEKIGNDSHRWDYKFEFLAFNGRVVKGFCYFTRLGSRSFQRLGAGQTFIVLYRANRPRHHIAYETAIYRAEIVSEEDKK